MLLFILRKLLVIEKYYFTYLYLISYMIIMIHFRFHRTHLFYEIHFDSCELSGAEEFVNRANRA